MVSGLVGQVIAIRIRRFFIQTPLAARQGLETQPRYEVPSDLWVKVVETQRLKSSE